jgi:hypothetical protein
LTIKAAIFGLGKKPVKNGTIVNFTTTLGEIVPNSVTTKNGLAIAQLVVGQTTGTAQVKATSGTTSSEHLKILVRGLVYLPTVIKRS